VGDVIVLEKRGHNALLFDEEVAGLVIDRLRQAQAMGDGAQPSEPAGETRDRDAAQ